MSDAFSAIGSSFRRYDGIATWEAIAQLTHINMGKTGDMLNVTSLDAVDKSKEYIKGFKDGGEVKLLMVFMRSTLEILDGDYESDEYGEYEIILPDDETQSFISKDW